LILIVKHLSAFYQLVINFKMVEMLV